MRWSIKVAALSAFFLSFPRVAVGAGAADLNGDGALDVSDAVVLLSYLFLGTELGSPTSDPAEVCFRPYLQPRSVDQFSEFIDSGDGTFTDTVTWLTWQRVPSDPLDVPRGSGQTILEIAVAYCETLELAGRDDWRLPNIVELLSLNPGYCWNVQGTDPCPVSEFLGLSNSPFRLLSSTPVPGESGARVYVVDAEGCFFGPEKPGSGRVLCVRGGHPRGAGRVWELGDLNSDGAVDISDAIFLLQYLFGGGPAPDEESCLMATGVTTSIVAGDDGYYQAGIPQPSERFVDMGNGVVLDRVTDLKWLKMSSEFGEGVGLDDYLLEAEQTTGLSGWRVPWAHELVSILDFTRVDPAADALFEFRNPGAGWYTLARGQGWGSGVCIRVLVGLRQASCFCSNTFSTPPAVYRLVRW